MTTSARARVAALRALRRDQYVAALLVGSVVILLGYASGLGLSTTAGTQPPSITTTDPQAATPTPSAVGTPTATPVAIAPPVAYVVAPAPAVRPAAGASPSGTNVSPTRASTHSSGAAPKPTPAPTTPVCSADLLSGLLTALAPSDGSSGLLAVLANLTGLLAAPTDLVATATSLLALTPVQLLDQVTSILGNSGLSGPCTTQLAAVLPLLAKGTSLSSALSRTGSGQQ